MIIRPPCLLMLVLLNAAAVSQAAEPPAKKIKTDPQEVRIIPYNHEEHYKIAKCLYKTAFDDYSLIKKMNNNPHATIALLEHNNRITALAIYSQTLVAINKLFPEKSTTERLKVCGLERIIVSPDQQGKGLGTKFMAYVEQKAHDHTDDIMILNSVIDQSHFYEKHGFCITKFEPTDNDNDDDDSTDSDIKCIEMMKPLNEKASLILAHVIDDRLKKATE